MEKIFEATIGALCWILIVAILIAGIALFTVFTIHLFSLLAGMT